MDSSSGIIDKIRENIILLIVGAVITFSLGIILSSVFVTIDIGFKESRMLGVAYKTNDPHEAFVTVTVTNEAPFEFPGVRTYYLLNVIMDEPSINSKAYYEDETWGPKYFPDEIYNLGYIRVAKEGDCLIYIKNVDERPGQVYFTIQVYTKIFGFPILIKEKQENFNWESMQIAELRILEDYLTILDINQIYFDISKLIPLPP